MIKNTTKVPTWEDAEESGVRVPRDDKDSGGDNDVGDGRTNAEDYAVPRDDKDSGGDNDVGNGRMDGEVVKWRGGYGNGDYAQNYAQDYAQDYAQV